MVSYGIVAIVKDEAASLGNIQRWMDRVPPETWTISDTGSRDGTAALLEGWGVAVRRDEWINFGHNRSLALARARGTADWLLTLDADMTFEIDADFEPDLAVDAYMIQMGTGDFTYRLPLLLRGDLPWESRGAVHEFTMLPGRDYVSAATDKVRVTMQGPDRSSREKTLWQAGMLEAELAEQPGNARSIFYLAQTYRELGDPRALALYERRTKMGGWVEEAFYARYRHALLLPTWPARMLALIATWESRPGRLEPVYELARELNYRGLHQAAYRFASVEVEPTDDILFVHRSIWDWGMSFERSIAAWWLAHWDEFDRLTEELLGNPRLPDNIRAQVIANSEMERAA
jgi:glycosyltransferase involved in cell wall biosynthesis